MATTLTIAQLRQVVQSTIDDLVAWFVAKPRLMSLPNPEQQVQFELAARLREGLRLASGHPTWDRLYLDGSSGGPAGVAGVFGRHPPIFVDTRQLLGVVSARDRAPAEPDLAMAVHVIRTVDETLKFDEDGKPAQQPWLPTSVQAQAFLLEARVQQLERISHQCCDGSLLVIYANAARRTTAVDTRQVASWASWQKPLDTLWWTVRHFRARGPHAG